MTFAQRIWRFFFPKPWNQCAPRTESERLADWEIRLGKHRAEQRLREARFNAAFDYRVTQNLAIKPRLPADVVVPFRKRRRA